MNENTTDVEKYEASLQDAKLAESITKVLTNEGLIALLKSFEDEIAALKGQVKELKKESDTYSGPHPLHRVRIPTVDEIKNIEALVTANTVTTFRLPPQLAAAASIRR